MKFYKPLPKKWDHFSCVRYNEISNEATSFYKNGDKIDYIPQTPLTVLTSELKEITEQEAAF